MSTTVNDLIQRAQAATSLSDFGEGDFREGLSVLVNSINTEARLTDRGRAGFEIQMVDLLSQRLQIEDWYRRHPEIDEQQIIAPLIGIGLPRTGSTAFSCLLAEDPNVRFIRSWEANHPCPPPEAATQHTDPRVAVTEAFVQRRNQMFPRKMTMLPSSATAPTECQTYMAYDFKSQLFHALWQVPSYVQWLNYQADFAPAYRYLKRVLKLLQWRCPPHRWRLKNPSHIISIDALAKEFPDARYWQTHRDISSVVPSVADLYSVLMEASTEHVDKHYLGSMCADWCELGMRRVIAFRDAGNDHLFFDVQFAAFQKDPYPDIARLYDFLGETFTDETRVRMETWRKNTPRDKHGDHNYDAADFGIDLKQLRERFRFYTERFNVPVKA